MRYLNWTHLLLATTLAVVTSATGCGDDDATVADAAPSADAGPFPPGFASDECLCLALGVDYMNGVGVAAVLGVPSLKTQRDVAAAGISGDPVVRYHEGKFYVVNRLVANLTIIDAATLAIDKQFLVGENGDNAQDVAVHGREAWIVYLKVPKVKIFDLDHPAAAPAEIALPTLAGDADGNPDASSIVITGDTAYVALQHLDDQFTATDNGGLVVIDALAKTVTSTHSLPGKNPINFLRTGGTDVYAGIVPDYTPANGCLASSGEGDPECMITSAALGGYVNGIAPAADGSLYVAAEQSFSAGQVVHVLAGGTLDAAGPLTPAAQQPTDVATCGKYVIMNDATGGGLRVYDASTRTELSTAALDVGEPPAFANGIACFAR